MLRNMVTDFFKHEKIRTTQAKAKALRPYAEKLITLGKKDTLTSRRRAARLVRRCCFGAGRRAVRPGERAGAQGRQGGAIRDLRPRAARRRGHVDVVLGAAVPFLVMEAVEGETLEERMKHASRASLLVLLVLTGLATGELPEW